MSSYPASSSSSTSSKPLLSYPTLDDVKPASSVPASTQRQRLFIGNLHPSVTEYSLLQIFSKYGKISNLDFLFHNTGLLKGKPRGYAFIEYANESDAARALESAHNKYLRGRNIVVTYANQAPLEAASISKPRKPLNEAGKPTALSMIKSGASTSSSQNKTSNKIAQMEAKLNQLQSTPSPSPSQSTIPSLPAKPPPPIPVARLAGQKPDLPSVPTTITKPPQPKQHQSRGLAGVIIKKKAPKTDS